MKNVRDLAYEDYLAGMKYKEIAGKHGVKESTVRSWANRYWKTMDLDDEAPLQQKPENAAKFVAEKKAKMKQKKDISWVEIEQEYVTDIRRKPYSLKELANKYDIGYEYMRRIASDNNWKEKRKKNITNISQKAVEKNAGLVSDKIARTNAMHYELSNILLAEMAAALKDDKELYKYVEVLREGTGQGEFIDKIEANILPALNSKKLNELTKALKDNQEIQRKALGILNPLEKQKLETETGQMKPIEITIKRAERAESDKYETEDKGDRS